MNNPSAAIAVEQSVARLTPHKSRRPKGIAALMRNYRTGLFRSIRIRKGKKPGQRRRADCVFGTYYDTWFSNAEPFYQLVKANPIVTLALPALGRADETPSERKNDKA